MHLKLIQKKRFKKQQKQLLTSLEIKLLIELKTSQQLHQKIIQKKNEEEEEIRRERYISPEQKQEITDDLRLT